MELARWKAPHGCDAVEPAPPPFAGAPTRLVAVATYALTSPATRTGGVSLLDVSVGPDSGGDSGPHGCDSPIGDSGESSRGSSGGRGSAGVGGIGRGGGGAVVAPRGAFSTSAVLDVRWVPPAAGSGRPAWPGDLLLVCADGYLRRVGVASPAATPDGSHPEQGGTPTDDPAVGAAAAGVPLRLTPQGEWAAPVPPSAGDGGGGSCSAAPLALSVGLVPPPGGDVATVFPPGPGGDPPGAAVVSYSSGAVAVVALDDDDGNGGGGVPPMVFPAAHAAEAWTAAALSSTLLASGGDDGVLALWDTRSPPIRAAARLVGAHGGVGVTTVAPVVPNDGGNGGGARGAGGPPPMALWSGGYDDTLRLWDIRCLGGRGGDGGGGVAAVTAVACGGGGVAG
ncbi:hypothetical protein MMPV_003778 [Pyropia vietnamensis]